MSPTVAAGLSPVRVSLDNGAVVIVQRASATPAVSINATFLAGGIHEPDDLTGLAYLTGRVIDRGTERRTADEIAGELDQRGVSLRIGTTRHTMTLSCTCLAEDFEDVLAIVMDVARRPTFPEEELAKRRAESMTALRQDEDNLAVRAVERFQNCLPARDILDDGQRTSKRSIGSIVVRLQISHRPTSALGASARRVGDVEPSIVDCAAMEIRRRPFPPAGPLIAPPPASRAVRRGRASTCREGPTTSRMASYHQTLDPRYYGYWMMNNILGQFGLGGRLADNIRERQGMAYYAFSSFDPTVGEGPLVVRAGVDPKNVERAIEAIDSEVRQLGERGPTALEVEETRAYLIGSIPRLLETNYSIAEFLQSCEQFGFGLDYDRRLPALLESVTMDEIRSPAVEVLCPERAAIAIAGPDLVNGARG